MVKYEKGFYIIFLVFAILLGIGVGLDRMKNPKILKIEDNKPAINSWSGIAFVVEDWFKNNLKDPKSLEIIEITNLKKADDGTYYQTIKYRAKNSLGGMNIENRIFIFDKNKVISAN